MDTSRCKVPGLFWPVSHSFQDVEWRPATDIYRTATGWLIKMDLAGVCLEEIELQIKGPRLSVQGDRRDMLLEEGCHYHSLEITYSHFERQMEFPEDLTEANIQTEYRAGMLLVRIQEKGRGHERSR